MTPKTAQNKRILRLFFAILAVILVYASVSYALLPEFWRHYEGHERIGDLALVTKTKLGIPGDALNVALEGDEADVVCALTAAGWAPADATTLRTSLKIAGSVIFDRPYPTAPVSDLYYNGRKQDLAFQKAAGKSADKRHHVRFWRALDAEGDHGPVWVGAVTFDRSVGVSAYTGQITHHIDADIDSERDRLTQDFVAAGVAEAVSQVSGVGPTLYARNGGGDFYFTDGEMSVVRLGSGCQGHLPPPPAPSAPAPRIGLKNQIFGVLTGLWRRF